MSAHMGSVCLSLGDQAVLSTPYDVSLVTIS
jgi:hypothetical protein